MDRIALRSPDLMTAWETMARWLSERMQFREQVNAWDQAGRPANRLYEGAQLHEIQTYHDRNRLERKFSDASRDRERRNHEWNRVLKWVFLGLALFILAGWFTALYSYHQAREKSTALNEAKATLEQKQQLTNIRLFVRGLGELKAAHSEAEQAIANTRWKALLAQFNSQFKVDPILVSPILDLNPEQIHQCAICTDGSQRLSADELAEIRGLRNLVVKNEALGDTLRAMRQVSFDMVKLSATKSVAELRARKPFNEIEPYIREFWAQYWGEMLLVEGPDVEPAMVHFGNALLEIQDEAETPSQEINDQIHSSVRQYAGDKGKQLIQKNPKIQLNAASFAQLDAQAQELKIPSDGRSQIQADLSKIRKKALAQPLTSEKLVDALDKELQPLVEALKAELKNPKIPPYPYSTGR
jgi:hypothetical protein